MLELLIEKQHPLIRHHPLLSILKVAKSENNIPDIESSAQSTYALYSSLLANPCSLILLVAIIHAASSYLHLLLLASSTVSIALFRHQHQSRTTTTNTATIYDENEKNVVVQKSENGGNIPNISHHSEHHHQLQHSYEAAGQLVPPLPTSSSSSCCSLLLQSEHFSSSLVSSSVSHQNLRRTSEPTFYLATSPQPQQLPSNLARRRVKTVKDSSRAATWWSPWSNTFTSKTSYFAIRGTELS